MPSILSRRRFGCATFAVASTAMIPAQGAPPSGDKALGAIEKAHGGRFRVFACRTAGDRPDPGSGIGYHADERVRMLSTFKGPLAAMVFARVDAGQENLNRIIGYGPGDMQPGSPVTAAHVKSGSMSVGALTEAILERSDNTAANLLLHHLGGPPALTAWLRSIGDSTTVIGRYEIMPGQTGPENTTTPRAMAETAIRISLGHVLSPKMRALNNRWMAANSVAMQRLRGAFPSTWSGLDRTGTSDSVRNDYAIVWPPSRPPVAIAAFYEKPALVDGQGEAMLRAVAAAISARIV